MSFFTLIAKNLLRQPVRTLLTTLGIAVGIATIVALGVIVDGLKASSSEILQAGGSDFMVGQKGSADLTFSTVTEDEWARIAAREDVELAVGAVIDISRVGGNAFFVTIGIDPTQLAETPLTLIEGSLLTGAPDEVMLGVRAANDLELTVGDQVQLHDESFTVAGIYQTGNLWQDAGAYAPLATIQDVAGRQGVVTVVFVTAATGQDPSVVASAIETDLPQLVAIEDQSDYGEVDQGLRIIDAATLAISLLAVGIGAIGVMNTMVMSVFERTREIGILRAMGWSGQRIVRMIISESLLLCVLASAVGIVIGVLLSRAVLQIDEIRSFLEPQYNVEVFIRAIVVGAVVALIGAVYPAFRAVRLTPMEALRNE